MNENIDEYINKLYMQFISAKGINFNGFSKEFYKEFKEWIKEQTILSLQYMSYLEYLNLDFKYLDCAEIGKCGFDSIAKYNHSTIISRVPFSFDASVQDRIIDGDMKVLHDKPTLIYPDGRIIELENDSFNTYMTQNPYSSFNINGWDRLHNFNECSIIVGIYGHKDDADFDSKKQKLDLFKDRLEDEYISEFDYYDDHYFYVIGSKRKQKKLIKTL